MQPLLIVCGDAICACLPAGCQPYTLYVSPVANVVMDAHAHMSSNEVIGILAGVFDPTTRTIRQGQTGGSCSCICLVVRERANAQRHSALTCSLALVAQLDAAAAGGLYRV